MPEFTIVHSTRDHFSDASDLGYRFRDGDPAPVLALMLCGGYARAGSVVATDIDHAYARSQNDFYAEGWNAPGDPRRSTSVGDLIGTEDGNVYIVLPFGFALVGPVRRLVDTLAEWAA